MSRKDIRLERKSAKAEKRREKSVRLAASFQNLAVKNQPKVAFLPDLEKIPIIGSSFGTLDVPKQPVA
ncbi:hypothetical protein QIH38_27595, partial [Klebsiella pneumoniae]|nr:hypothetical protein [Klebsiella pneumoniae]